MRRGAAVLILRVPGVQGRLPAVRLALFIVGVEGEDEVRYYCMPRPALHVLTTHRPLPVQNELAVLEFIHALVETLDRYFENVVRLPALF